MALVSLGPGSMWSFVVAFYSLTSLWLWLWILRSWFLALSTPLRTPWLKLP